jgi:3-isopropylmalate dehydrogenase
MRILVMAGDGIGEEITAATLEVLRAADARFGLGLDFEHAEIGLKALAKHGTTLPEGVLERARSSDGILLGPISHLDYPPPEQGGVNISGVVRVQLDLYANVRPARTRPGLPAKGGTFDLVIMREATEGFYPDRNMFAGRAEFMTDPDTALSIRKITRKASERIARRAYELAMKRRKKVAVIHKANTFRLSDGLFLEACRDVARDFPEVETEEVIVDAMAALLVRQPERYDVICATNFHADILSDLASELSGSLGLAGSVNAGDALCCAQAQHGSAPDLAGRDRANPTSLILSAAMLLDWLAEKRGLAPCGAAARAIEAAIDAALAAPETRTADLGGALGTRAFTSRIAAALAG